MIKWLKEYTLPIALFVLLAVLTYHSFRLLVGA